MRGALKDMPGVARVDIEQGERNFVVHYDSAKANPQQMLTAVHAAGEKDTKLKG